MDKKYTIEDLLEIIKVLRGENGCPWDKVQTHQSIKKSLIEESYETIEALDSGDDKAFANELGDVLLQVAFHSVLAKEREAFEFDDVLNEVCTKLISRHTHVFGADKAGNTEEALDTWEKNKKKEKELKTNADILNDVPHSLPALMRAQKVQKKASSCGFDWENISGVFDKINEEMEELGDAYREGVPEKIEEEFGDLLFSVVNLSRFLGVDSEEAMTSATNKFIKRFTKMESLATESGEVFSELSPPKMDVLWEKVK